MQDHIKAAVPYRPPFRHPDEQGAKRMDQEAGYKRMNQEASSAKDAVGTLTFSREDIKYMKAALKQAQKALALGEVPIGAVIVEDGKIIGRGYNRRNTDHTTLAHAEITAIRKANRKVGDWRLEGCTLYVTLEPCQMCAGALVQSRIDRVVIGAPSFKSGCGGTLLNILQNNEFNHQVVVETGLLQEECTAILQQFFKELRARNKMRKKTASKNTASGTDGANPPEELPSCD